MNLRILSSFPVTVGIVGHRNLGNHVQGLRVSVGMILEDIRFYAQGISRQCRAQCPEILDGLPHLRVYSCLCAGADQMAAEEALRRGYTLDVILPFSRGMVLECESQEGPVGREAAVKLASLLKEARHVVELPVEGEVCVNTASARDLRQKAYHAAGLRLIEACDVLIAVWRGDMHASQGSTSGLVHAAQERGIPVIWIHSDSDAEPLLAEGGKGRWVPARKRLKACMEERLGFLGALGDAKICESNVRELRHCLRAVQGDTAPSGAALWRKCLLPAYASLWRRFEKLWYNVPCEVSPHGLEEDNTLYRRFDALAGVYANLHRSSLLVGCTVSALALLCGTAALLFSSPLQYAACTAELFLLCVVIANYKLSTTRQWQRRLTNTRYIAECLRGLSYAHLYGYTLYSFSGQQYNKDEDAWAYWLAHRLEREQGLPQRNIQEEDGREALQHLLASQIAYHKKNSQRSGTIYHALHTTTVWLFAISCVAVLLELLHVIPAWNLLLAFCSIACPVLGMAAHTLCHYAELKRLRERSLSMQECLQKLEEKLKTANTTEAALIALQTVNLMVQESADWKVQYNIPDICLA